MNMPAVARRGNRLWFSKGGRKGRRYNGCFQSRNCKSAGQLAGLLD